MNFPPAKQTSTVGPVQRQRIALVGWREWLSLPDLGIGPVKVKVDTGAKTSALHADNLEVYVRRGQSWVRFDFQPLEFNGPESVTKVRARVADWRAVKDSGGRITRRPVITSTAVLGSYRWPIELTLVDRTSMGFRMLLGRQALAGLFAVDPSRSFLQSQVNR